MQSTAFGDFYCTGTLCEAGTSSGNTAITFGGGGEASFAHTYAVTSTDPVVTYSDAKVDFSTPVYATSFVADASATPTHSFDDDVAAGTEAKIVGNASADNNGGLSLQVEQGDVNYVHGVTILNKTAGEVVTRIGDANTANYQEVSEAGVTTFVGTSGITKKEVCGSIVVNAATADTLVVSKALYAMTVTDIHCVTDAGTASIHLEECNSSAASCANVDDDVCSGATTPDEDDGTIDSPLIEAGNWWAVEVASVSGADEVTLTFYCTYTVAD
jgi:hypothetical protein